MKTFSIKYNIKEKRKKKTESEPDKNVLDFEEDRGTSFD